MKPFKRIGNKSIITDTIFDLQISKSMKSFVIHGHFRASNSYWTFLGNFLSLFIFLYSCMDNIICEKLFTFHCSNSFEILIFFYVASFRHGLPTNKQIHRLNQNALVSLSNTNISIEKVKINIMTNPNTTFLEPTNATVDIINAFIVELLFSNQTPLMTIKNSQQKQMLIYRNMSLVITENRYIFYIWFYIITTWNTAINIFSAYLLLPNTTYIQNIALIY